MKTYPFFDDMLQVEIWMLKKLDVIGQGCIELACVALFNSQHILETHRLCVWSRDFKSEKIPNRFESREFFILHAKSHQFRTEKTMECSLCLEDYSIPLSLGNILNRIDMHVTSITRPFLQSCSTQTSPLGRQGYLVSESKTSLSTILIDLP